MNELTRRQELIMMLECIKDSIVKLDDESGSTNTIISGVRPSSTEFVLKQTIKYLEVGDDLCLV